MDDAGARVAPPLRKAKKMLENPTEKTIALKALGSGLLFGGEGAGVRRSNYIRTIRLSIFRSKERFDLHLRLRPELSSVLKAFLQQFAQWPAVFEWMRRTRKMGAMAKRHDDKESFWCFTPRNPDSAPSLAVVIVTDNSAGVLPGLLDSLRAGLEGIEKRDLIVVDNGSSDGSAELALAHPTLPRVIRLGRNAGYAAGINAALATVEPCADVLILNPEIRLFPGAACCLVDRLNDRSVGVVVPQIVDEDDEIFCSLRREPSMKTAWSDALLGTGIAARAGLGEIVNDPVLYRQGGRIEWAKGAVVAVAARARLAVGDWDESFLPDSVEVDYFERVRRCGLSVEYVSQARAIHIGGEYQDDPRLSALTTACRIHYYRKHHGRLATILFRLSIVVGEAMRAATGPGHRAALRAALAL